MATLRTKFAVLQKHLIELKEIGKEIANIKGSITKNRLNKTEVFDDINNQIILRADELRKLSDKEALEQAEEDIEKMESIFDSCIEDSEELHDEYKKIIGLNDKRMELLKRCKRLTKKIKETK